jgi:hypothetical protein
MKVIRSNVSLAGMLILCVPSEVIAQQERVFSTGDALSLLGEDPAECPSDPVPPKDQCLDEVRTRKSTLSRVKPISGTAGERPAGRTTEVERQSQARELPIRFLLAHPISQRSPGATSRRSLPP